MNRIRSYGMSFKDKIVLVTGGAGFIGSNLTERLLNLGTKKVYVLDNFVSGKLENIEHLMGFNNFQLIEGDVRDYNLIKSLVRKSDFIFHLAASKLVVSRENPKVDLETNIIGTFNILEVSRLNKKVRIIHASTGSTLGSSSKPMKEDHHPKPTTLYGISKLTAEHYCLFYAREFDVKVSIIRYFHVFGPHQDYSGKAGVVNIFLSKVLQGKPPIINGTGRQVRCLTYVQDDVDATLLIARKSEAIGQIYNIASPTRIKVRDLAYLIIRKYGRDGLKPVYGPARPGENLRPIPDTRKIEKLGFKARFSFNEGLELTKQWIENDLKRKGYKIIH